MEARELNDSPDILVGDPLLIPHNLVLCCNGRGTAWLLLAHKFFAEIHSTKLIVVLNYLAPIDPQAKPVESRKCLPRILRRKYSEHAHSLKN